MDPTERARGDALEQQVAALRGRVAAAAHRGEEAHVLLVELRLRGEAAAREVREAHARLVGFVISVFFFLL